MATNAVDILMEDSTGKDWRRVAGIFTGNEFQKQIDAEALAIREADRKAAREEPES